jgi:RHS repeat-associated protein
MWEAENRQSLYLLYDAEGRRVAKLGGTSLTSSPITAIYILGTGGEQLSELDGSLNWKHSDAYVGGKLLATYDSAGTHFHFTDWLGSRRLQVRADGSAAMQCVSLPFGEDMSCGQPNGFAASDADGTEHHFTGKERDTESGSDYFKYRYYASSMGRWMSPDPAGMMAVDITDPQSLNRYAYVQNNALSFIDPYGLDCAYLNNAGNGVESVDQQSNSGECGKNGGYWVDGGLTNININADQGAVQMTGTNDGTDKTHASYQDTNVYVGKYLNDPIGNPFGHIAMAFPGQTPVGWNPRDDSQWKKSAFMNGWKTSVPGAVKKQIGGQLKQTIRIPVTGMQAQMIQNAIDQSKGNYTLGEGNGCDCGTWAQQMLGDAGINSGSPARMPTNLMNQLQQIYPQQ